MNGKNSPIEALISSSTLLSKSVFSCEKTKESKFVPNVGLPNLSPLLVRRRFLILDLACSKAVLVLLKNLKARESLVTLNQYMYLHLNRFQLRPL